MVTAVAQGHCYGSGLIPAQELPHAADMERKKKDEGKWNGSWKKDALLLPTAEDQLWPRKPVAHSFIHLFIQCQALLGPRGKGMNQKKFPLWSLCR